MLVEVTLTAVDAAEALADALLERGALSVSIEDASAGTLDEQPLYGEPGFQPAQPAWARSKLRVLVEDDGADAMIEAACAATQSEATVETRVLVENTDWVRQSQSQFGPTRISERLWIVPSWHAPPDEQAVVVRLDPGIAFGTGTHPTTRLCLAWLDTALVPGASVLDYGCGSGILAIAALKLGYAPVEAFDFDRDAVRVAKENARVNGVRLVIRQCDLTRLSLRPTRRFGVICANLIYDLLIQERQRILSRLAPGGTLVVAGILREQFGMVRRSYEQAGMRLMAERVQGEWHSGSFQMRS